MTDPYTLLGEQLIAAAHRQEAHGRPTSAVRAWLSRRLNAAVMAVVLVLAGGAVAVAATGVLDGSPVKQTGGPLSPTVGNGIPAVGGSRLLALRAADPEGGLPWGMQLVRTTRGQVCIQIGRVHDGQLGELGIDGAFHDDGRFHLLSPDILPGPGSATLTAQCILAGQSLTYQDSSEDRSAAWIAFAVIKAKPPKQDLRSISYGLLGPHAVSITYRTDTGMQTRPVSRGTGAYLIVRPAGEVVNGGVGESFVGEATAHAVYSEPLAHALYSEARGVVSAISYRFGSLVCSVGAGAPVSTPCPGPRATPEGAFDPTRSLNEPVHATPVRESHDSCAAAFLADPCYRAEVQFTAPYAVTRAGAEYAVSTKSNCRDARLAGWGIDRDIKQGETVRARSMGAFRFCASPQELEVQYLNPQRPSAGSPHQSIIVGNARVSTPTEARRAP